MRIAGDPSTLEFCRQARRIRARFAGRPHELHAALRSLSTRATATRTIPEIPDDLEEHARARFVRAVIERLDGTVLRYSLRLELLDIAGRLGLTRFDANVIIAQVQHHAGIYDARLAEPPKAPLWSRRLLPLVVAIGMQAGLIFAAWRIVAG